MLKMMSNVLCTLNIYLPFTETYIWSITTSICEEQNWHVLYPIPGPRGLTILSYYVNMVSARMLGPICVAFLRLLPGPIRPFFIPYLKLLKIGLRRFRNHRKGPC